MSISQAAEDAQVAEVFPYIFGHMFAHVFPIYHIDIVVPKSPQLSVRIEVLLMGKDIICVMEHDGISYDD